MFLKVSKQQESTCSGLCWSSFTEHIPCLPLDFCGSKYLFFSQIWYLFLTVALVFALNFFENNTPFATIDTAIIRISSTVLLCKKGILTNCAKLTRKYQKRDSGRLLHHKHSFYLLSHHDLWYFQKQCHKYFLTKYFYWLTCRMETRVRSIYQALIQKPIFDQVKYLGWSFFEKTVNRLKKPLSIFDKKASFIMFDQVLITNM